MEPGQVEDLSLALRRKLAHEGLELYQHGMHFRIAALSQEQNVVGGHVEGAREPRERVRGYNGGFPSLNAAQGGMSHPRRFPELSECPTPPAPLPRDPFPKPVSHDS